MATDREKEEVEAVYRRSAFVKEICVLGLAHEGEPSTERLVAVVVPNMDLMRERRIANAGDLIRFEMEGQSILLPAHKRVVEYDVWFDPLPRTIAGALERPEIERLLLKKRQQGSMSQRQADPLRAVSADDVHTLAALEVIQRHSKRSCFVADSNLELDLGLDSMERVELITELERRFRVRVPDEQSHHILTVAHLIEAVRPGASIAATGPLEESWAVLLRDLPAESDPVLSGLLESRPVASVVFFALLRCLRLFAPRLVVFGLEHLPAKGPYIISPNHQGYLDPFLLCAVLPFRIFRQLFFVGATEYFETPFTRWIARKGNCLPVDPDANLVPAMKAGAFGLTHGKILMLFPEGERSIDGTVKRFKKGAPILSRHLNVPIVPVAIRGAYEVWPRNRPLNWKLSLPFSGHRIKLAIGTPMRVDADRSYADAAVELRDRIARMWTTLAPVAADGDLHAAGKDAGARIP